MLTSDSVPSYRRLPMLVLGVVIAAILLLYRDTAMGMVNVWYRSETFAHGFLVVPISAWLIWRQRQHVAVLAPAPQPLFLIPMAVIAAAFFAADLVVVNAASQFAMVGIVILAVPAVLGAAIAKRILFPLLFLLFAVPFGEFIVPTMMDWTADFVVAAVKASGVPVYREGLQFMIPTGSWSVIDECSGVRYVMASFMVGSLFAYLNYRSYRKRALFMLFALLVPVVANWFRAYMIVMIGHLSGNKLAVGVDHIIYGWVFFGIVIFVMFAIGSRWAEPDEPAPAAGPGVVPAPAIAPGFVWLAALGAAALAAAPHGVVWAFQQAERSAAAPVLSLPAPAAGWERAKEPQNGWKLPYEGATATALGGFAGPAGTVGVYVAYYRGQTHERKLVTSTNSLVSLNDREWKQVQSGQRALPVAGAPVTLRTAQVHGPGDGSTSRKAQLIIWHAYWIGGRWIVGDALAKLATALERISGRGDDGAGVILFADEGSPAASERALAAFAEKGLDGIDAMLQKTRSSR